MGRAASLLDSIDANRNIKLILNIIKGRLSYFIIQAKKEFMLQAEKMNFSNEDTDIVW